MKRSVAMSRGMKRYRNGKPCPAGHEGIRYVTTGNCVHCQKANAIKWRSINPQKVRDYSKSYREKNLKEVVRKYKTWRTANRRLANQLTKEWRQRNPENHRISEAKRRAARRASPGKHTIKEIREMLEQQKYECLYCFKSLRKIYHIDHKTPLSRGGSNDIGNIQILCPTCNMKKHTKDHEAYLQQLRKGKQNEIPTKNR